MCDPASAPFRVATSFYVNEASIDSFGLAAVAPCPGLGCLDEGTRAFEQSVADAAVVPADDPVPVRFDELDEVLHRLQPAVSALIRCLTAPYPWRSLKRFEALPA